MRITSKGQVTIPKAMRDELGMLPGTEVEFVVGDDAELRVRRSKSGQRRGREFIEHLHEAGRHITMTTDEIMKLTRGEDWGTGHLEGDGRDPR